MILVMQEAQTSQQDETQLVSVAAGQTPLLPTLPVNYDIYGIHMH